MAGISAPGRWYIETQMEGNLLLASGVICYPLEQKVGGSNPPARTKLLNLLGAPDFVDLSVTR
jgi:hypothetical protein